MTMRPKLPLLATVLRPVPSNYAVVGKRKMPTCYCIDMYVVADHVYMSIPKYDQQKRHPMQKANVVYRSTHETPYVMHSQQDDQHQA